MRPPEEVKWDLVQRWIARAEQDFGVADHLIAHDAPWLNAVAFHAQQAAEKLLKAVLVRHQNRDAPFEIEDHVGGLDVAVDDVVPVGVAEGVGDLPQDLRRPLHGELPLTLQDHIQRLALQVLHHVPEELAAGGDAAKRG